MDPALVEAIGIKIDKMVKAKHAVEVQNADSLRGIIPLFAVDKKTDNGLDARLIIDATYINKYIDVGVFALPRPNALLSRTNEWFGSIDIANAYLNFPVSSDFAKF